MVAEQHTNVNKGVCYFVIYNGFEERGSANQSQGPELCLIINKHVTFSVKSQNYEKTSIKV